MNSCSALTVLDIGNTHVRIVDTFGDGFCRIREIVPTSDFLLHCEAWITDPANTAAASVVPAVSERLKQAGVFLVSSHVKLPFASPRVHLATVGADRLANAAELTAGMLPALCIDFGTAITFELVTGAKEFSGGAILPGRMLMRRALNNHTAQLPLIVMREEIPPVPGTTTEDAMRIGTDLASVGAVREIRNACGMLFPETALNCIACGGDRSFFLRHLDGLKDGGEFFTFRGIRRIWECNQCG